MAFTYTTSGLREKDRASYWRDAIAKTLIPADLLFDDEKHFDAKLMGSTLNRIDIGHCRARAHTFIRTESAIRRAPSDDFVLIFLHAGSMKISQCGNTTSYEAGSIALLDAGRTFSHELGEVDQSVLRIPRHLLLTQLPQAHLLAGRDLAVDAGPTSILFAMMNEALTIDAPGRHKAASTLENALLEMLMFSMSRQLGSDAVEEGAKYRDLTVRAKQYIDRRLDDPDLAVDSIAGGIGTSKRTLSRAFAVDGETITQYIWNRRLQLSYLLLTERRVDRVTQAAFRTGFSDLSHYSRSFKSRFGISPSALLRDTA